MDPGEKLSAALKREFGEEALNSLQKTAAEKEEMEKQLNRLFNQDHFVVSTFPLLGVGMAFKHDLVMKCF